MINQWEGKVFLSNCSWKQWIAIWNKAKFDSQYTTLFISSESKDKILKYNDNINVRVDSVGEWSPEVVVPLRHTTQRLETMYTENVTTLSHK